LLLRWRREARVALQRARLLAQRLEHREVDPEHLLLGLIEDPVVAVLLTAHDATTERIRARLLPFLMARAQGADAELPIGPRLDDVLAFADEERVGFGHRALSAGHMLLGLIKEDRGHSGLVLAECGVHLEPMRQRVLESLAALYP
jgi:ATP-dependent Clp protease ATP-binding subunit ClpA